MAAFPALVFPAVGAWGSGNHVVPGDRYIGATNQGQATTIIVAADGRSIVALLTTVTYDGRCGSRPGGLPYQILSDQRVPIRPNGNFRESTHGTTTGPGSVPMMVTGTFARGKVHGTIVETGSSAHCAAPRQSDDPYAATFSAQGVPALSP